MNEQELTLLSKVGDGPHREHYPIVAGTLHTYKVCILEKNYQSFENIIKNRKKNKFV
jgi:hypothetical protein